MVRTKSNKFGEVVDIDLANQLVRIKKTKKTAQDHPRCVYVDPTGPNTDVLADSLYRLGEYVRGHGIHDTGPYQCARDLLSRTSPRFTGGRNAIDFGGNGLTDSMLPAVCGKREERQHHALIIRYSHRIPSARQYYSRGSPFDPNP